MIEIIKLYGEAVIGVCAVMLVTVMLSEAFSAYCQILYDVVHACLG